MQEVDEKQVALEFLIGDLANIKDYLVECRKRLDAIKKGSWKKYSSKAVSYTHLTLPTICSV